MAAASSHYDAKASAPCSGALARSPLQTFHNDAKRALLTQFVRGGDSLLDLACGRGGDLHKWRALGVHTVVGVDISPMSVREAMDRFAKTHGSQTYDFRQADLREGTFEAGRKFDVVTCMFALHYFFESESSANKFLATAARHLTPDGYFVGIVPDALQINECIKHGPFDNGLVRVEAKWHGTPRCFGSAYTCSIRGTVTEGSVVPEYLVYANVLSALAGAHGLEAVDIRHPMFAPSRGGMHRLLPPYEGHAAECSGLYAAFAFRKLIS